MHYICICRCRCRCRYNMYIYIYIISDHCILYIVHIYIYIRPHHLNPDQNKEKHEVSGFGGVFCRMSSHRRSRASPNNKPPPSF